MKTKKEDGSFQKKRRKEKKRRNKEAVGSPTAD